MGGIDVATLLASSFLTGGAAKTAATNNRQQIYSQFKKNSFFLIQMYNVRFKLEQPTREIFNTRNYLQTKVSQGGK